MTTDRTFRTLVCVLGMLVLSLLAGAGTTFAATAGDLPPSISSDKADYAPGEVVVLTGAGWQPGEAVHVHVNDDHGSTWSRDADMTADAQGVISDTFTLPGWFVAEYTVTATSPSGATATWTFTDGNVKVNLGPSPYTAFITATAYSATGCTGSTTDKSGTAGNGATLTVGIGNTESLRLDAPATASSGASTRAFVNWTGDAGLSFTTIAGTNGRSVCVAGFQSGNMNIFANYSPVGNASPTVTAAANQSATEGAARTIDLGSFVDPDGSPWTIDVNWGDGATESFTAAAQGALGTRNHTYADGPANRTVSVKVTDKEGGSGTSTFTVVVANATPVVTAAAAQNAAEGAATDIDLGSFTDAGAGDSPWAIDVDWGDGSAHRTFSTTSTAGLGTKPHTYADGPAARTVSVKVTDKDGGTDTKTFAVNVSNVAPSATLGNDGPITEGGPAGISFSGQSDPSAADTAAGLHYAFHCDGSVFSTVPSYASASAAASKSCDFADNGTYTVRALIIDRDEGAREYTTDVVVTNAAPAMTAPADQSSDEGESKAFDLGSFTDAGANDNPWAVDVDWGDGSAHTTFSAASRGSLGTRNHAYADGPATRTVTVKVTDKDGASDTKTFGVTVKNVAPTVKLDAANPAAADEGQTKTYTYSISDPGVDTVSGLAASCGTGGELTGETHTNTTGSFDCRFPDGPADTTVSIRATDSDNDQGAADTQSVHVSNVAPTVRLTGDTSVDEGSTHTYTFTVSDPGQDGFDRASGYPTCDTTGTDGTLVAGSYSADATGGSIKCSFPDGPATADVKIKVADSDGDSGTDSESVNVVSIANVAPVLTAPADQSAKEGATKAIELGSFTDPGTDTWTADVDWGDGHTSSFAPGTAGPLGTRDHAYDDNGTYTVSVKVTDKDNGSDTKTFKVTVDNIAPTAKLDNDGPILEGSAATVSFSAQSDPSGADTTAGFHYAFHCDGAAFDAAPTYAGTTNDASKSCDFADDGTHTVRGRILDKDGGVNEYTTDVVVTNATPDVTAPAGQGSDEGEAKSFDLGSFTDAGSNDGPWSVDVDWGDGSTHSTFDSASRGSLGSETHTYADDGAYTVKVSVTDKDHAGGSKSFQVAVKNVAPTVTLAAGNAQTVAEGTTSTYTYSISDPGRDTVSAVATDCGANGQKVGASSHTDTSGSFQCLFPDGPADTTVSASATDSDGAQGAAGPQSVHVDNVAPKVVLNGATDVDEGTTHSYTFTVTDPGQDTFTASTGYPTCDTAGSDGKLVDGSYDADAGGGSFKCSFPDGPSTADVRMKVADSDGASGTDSESVNVVSVANVAPVVTAAADQSANEGASTSFQLGSFADGGADTWTLDVDWGDGTPHATGSPAAAGSLGSQTHTYANNGTYTVSVKVTDKDRGSDTKTFTVAVANVAPKLTKPTDDNADEGAAKDFGLGSFTDPGADADWSVDVDWGDDSAPSHSTRAAAGSLGLANHAYDDNGTYTVSVKVADKDGASDTMTYTVSVANVAPTAELSNNGPIAEGGSATITFANAKDPSAADTTAGFKYAIACDGSTPATADAVAASTKSCTFAQDGTKTVKGIVVDKNGGTREYTTSVVVSNALPVVTAPADQSADEGAAKAFDLGSFTDAGAGDSPWKVSVNWGDSAADAAQPDSAAQGSLGTASHKYADNGTYTVTVTVTDKDGGSGSKTFKVAVANVAPKITSFTGTDYLVGANAFLAGSSGTGLKSTLTTTFTDPGADTWKGEFAYADGTPLTGSISPFTSGMTQTHTFSGSGCKSASVKVSDDDGGSDTGSTTVKVGTGTFQPPMTNQPVTDKLKNGQVLPVKVHVNDCAGLGVAGLSPAIRLVKGDLTPQSDDLSSSIAPPSTSAADTTGVMRSQGGGDYIYNMQVSLPALNTDYTVVIYPYGTGSLVQLGHVIQATK